MTTVAFSISGNLAQCKRAVLKRVNRFLVEFGVVGFPLLNDSIASG
jgi:hypothetical protein